MAAKSKKVAVKTKQVKKPQAVKKQARKVASGKTKVRN